MRAPSFSASALSLFTCSLALAAPKVKVDDTPKLPVPEVRMSVSPRATSELWDLEVKNDGSVPLVLVADVRLLRLSITPPASATPPPVKKGQKSKPPPVVECSLPASMRSDGRTLVLPPGARYVEPFDPRLFCLDRVNALESGAIVVARLGWAAPAKGALTAPFVVRPPLSESSPSVAAAKEIVAPAVVLDASVSAGASGTPSNQPPIPLVAKAGGARSVAFGMDAEVTIFVKNESAETQIVYARPQLVDAAVVGPAGDRYKCTGPIMQPAPIADFVTRLPPKGTWTASVSLKSICPQGTFDRPGLYTLRPLLHAPTIPFEKKAFVGDVIATNVQLLRVETGTKPFHDGMPAAKK